MSSFLSRPHFDRLASILTESNEHYRTVAAEVRAAKRPTHHARTRAHKLGLAVNITRAVNCPEGQVSTIPLPIVDRAPSPSAPARKQRPTLRLVVPRAPADVPASSGPYSTLSLSSASATITPTAVPTVLRGQHVPWRGPTSRFSLTPEPPVVPDVPFDEMDDDTLFDTYELGYPESGAADYASSSTSYGSSSGSSPSSSSSYGSSAASSRGPTTPADTEMYPVSTKRKFVDDAAVEKRPKYGRKSWARTPRKLL
ncbi:hypothetical protein C8R44DRAFT_939092 [Mycena epipterygia]|nr:hypothetical protein C8R44DRAFT_939092 [Mycena epipterygia]